MGLLDDFGFDGFPKTSRQNRRDLETEGASQVVLSPSSAVVRMGAL